VGHPVCGRYPNASSRDLDPPYEKFDDTSKNVGCHEHCCLFDIFQDPLETQDLRLTEPELFKNMTLALAERSLSPLSLLFLSLCIYVYICASVFLSRAKTVYQTRYAEPNTPECFTGQQMKDYYQGFMGPSCFAQLPTPVSLPDLPAAGVSVI